MDYLFINRTVHQLILFQTMSMFPSWWILAKKFYKIINFTCCFYGYETSPLNLREVSLKVFQNGVLKAIFIYT
jgi:hypothetical protein